MIELPFFNGLPVAVFGLGKAGLAAAKALQASGADVWAWDDNEDRRAKAREQEIPLVDLYHCNWEEVPSLILAPGVAYPYPEPHPIPAAAAEAGCEVIGEIELLGRAQPDAQYVGVTGTNGKSTTTALIGHIMELGGIHVQVGGNIGTPATALEPVGNEGTYVLEMSSYQLERTLSITFNVAVLLNITPDHIERHRDLDGYIAAKKQIFHRQTRPRAAVVGVDDPICQSIFEELTAADEQIVVPISGERQTAGGVYVLDGVLTDDTDGSEVAALDLSAIATLPGRHNWQNAAAAYAACKVAGMQPPVIAACIRSFPGLAHRQEPVARIDGVVYINDSKATNAEAAARALACYDPVYWIAGGRAKEGGIKALAPFLPRVAHAFLIGEAAEAFGETLDEHDVSYDSCGDLETAVAGAAARAAADGRAHAVVLLSPAAASFDQFDNFEARGDAFKALVRELPGTHEEVS
jgi:UDP-N-acetylmuramoylalanine--D-glutamate ligase